MTVSMMNLLIGIAVGDIGELRQQSDQDTFRSKVDLILQYNYMFQSISSKLHQQDLRKFRKFRLSYIKLICNNCFYMTGGTIIKLTKHINDDTQLSLCAKICICLCMFSLLIFFWWLVIPVSLAFLLSQAKYNEKLFTKYKEELYREYKKYATVNNLLDRSENPSLEILMKEIERLHAEMKDQRETIHKLNDTVNSLNFMIKKQNENIVQYMNGGKDKREKRKGQKHS